MVDSKPTSPAASPTATLDHRTERATMTHPIISQIRQLLGDTLTELDRAQLLHDLVQAAYDATKFTHPGGEGLDGRDGTERHEIGDVLEKAINHHDAAIHRWHNAQSR